MGFFRSLARCSHALAAASRWPKLRCTLPNVTNERHNRFTSAVLFDKRIKRDTLHTARSCLPRATWIRETARDEQQILGDLQRGRHFSRVERRLEILQRRLGEIVHLFVRHFRFCQLIARHAGGRLSFPVAFVIVEVAVSQLEREIRITLLYIFIGFDIVNVGNFGTMRNLDSYVVVRIDTPRRISRLFTSLLTSRL